jgi:hypothetical protein
MLARCATDRVEMHRQPARRRGVPHRVPPGIPQRRHAVFAGNFEAAHIAAARHALDFADRSIAVMVRDVGEAGIALGLLRTEIGEPVVVDAQHFAGRLVVVEAACRAEDAVQHLGLYAVALLILEAQIGVCQAPDFFLLRIVQPGRGHPVGTVDFARFVEPPGRAHPAIETEGGAVLGHPFAAARSVGNIGHAVLELGGGVGGEQVGRQPDQIDVAIGRDDVVFHRAILFPLTVGSG